MDLIKYLILFIAISILSNNGYSQSDTISFADKTQKGIEKVFKYSPIPFAGYATETDLVLGITKYNAFKISSGKIPDSLIQPSSVLAYFYYTLNHQYKVYLNADIMHGDNKYNSKIEFLFLDYPSLYFGIGNQNDFDSSYMVDFKNLMIAPAFSYNIYDNMYIGLKYTFNNYITVETLDGLAIDSSITKNSGIQSGIGLHFHREARDNRISATKGSYLYLSYDYYTKALGSKFNYGSFTFDYRKYITPIKKITIASQFYSTLTTSETPIQSQPVVGGAYRMRGIYEARYRDKNMIAAQLELRYPIVWIVSGTVFGGMGQVAPKISDFKISDFHYGYGLGLRLLIDEATSSVLRFDLSFATTGHTIFIGFNEAF